MPDRTEPRPVLRSLYAWCVPTKALRWGRLTVTAIDGALSRELRKGQFIRDWRLDFSYVPDSDATSWPVGFVLDPRTSPADPTEEAKP